MIEREHRFLVKNPIEAILEANQKVWIEQYYLSTKPAIRVRYSEGKYILTSKRRIDRESSNEVEIELDPAAGIDLIENALGSVQKWRLSYGSGWIVDVFMGDNSGLVIAEIELGEGSDIKDVMHPNWLGREITGVRKYANSQLAVKPFKEW